MRHLHWDRTISIALISPSVIGVMLFVYGFIGWTGFISLTKWNKLLPDYTVVGLSNYQKLFTHFRFQIDVRNLVVFTVLFLVLSLLIGFMLWRWVLNPGSIQMGSTGINLLLERAGLGFLKSGWYTDPKIGIKAVVIAAVWQMSGYVVAMYVAGLRSIPEELREAARIDGASEIQIYRYVILPLLRPITLGAVIILGHISLKIFDLIVAMTGPGIGFCCDVPAYFMWETTFHSNRFAQGASIAIIMLMMVAVLIVPYLVYSLRKEAQL